MFGIISGIVNFFFKIFTSIFNFLGRISNAVYQKFKFLYDALNEDIKTMNKLKAFSNKQKKLIKLNNEV